MGNLSRAVCCWLYPLVFSHLVSHLPCKVQAYKFYSIRLPLLPSFPGSFCRNFTRWLFIRLYDQERNLHECSPQNSNNNRAFAKHVHHRRKLCKQPCADYFVYVHCLFWKWICFYHMGFCIYSGAKTFGWSNRGGI